MQPFNIEAFKKNLENEYDDTWVGTDKDGNYLMQGKYDNTYVEEWSPTNSPYLYRTTYDLQGVVISKNTRLYNMNIEYQEFDKNGNVTKTVNYDVPYKFTIAQLQKKLKQAYHLDLMDTQEVRTIYRYDEDYQNNKISVYQVITYTKTNKSMLNYFYIDGDTGKTLFTTKHHMLDRKSPTPDEQFSQLLESNQITR